MIKKERTKKHSDIQTNVNRRFFIALQSVIDAGKVHSMRAFCEECGYRTSALRDLSREYGVHPLGVHSKYASVSQDALYHIVMKFSISSDWLLTGRGAMVKKYRIIKHNETCNNVQSVKRSH